MHSKVMLLKHCHVELTAQGTLKKKDQRHKVSLSLVARWYCLHINDH